MFKSYDYATAKSDTENFFWNELADNYLEMCKLRLYDEMDPKREGALFTLYVVLLTMLKLFAPFLPHITEEIYQRMFIQSQETISIHQTNWPIPDENLEDKPAEQNGEILIAIATAVRRYKSEQNLPLGSPIHQLQLMTGNPTLADTLLEAISDLRSVTRAQQINLVKSLDADTLTVLSNETLMAALR